MHQFDGMEIFAAVVEAGGFSAAARKLELAKSTVSASVADLEARLGARLLDRTTRRLSPTEAGRLYYARCKRALEEAELGRSEVRAAQAEPAGRLRVASPGLFTALHLVPAATRFLVENPRLEIEFVESPGAARLVEEGLDLAIRVSPEPEPNLIVRRLASSSVVIVASQGYLKEHGTPRHPADAAAHRTLGFSPLFWGREWRFEGPKGIETFPIRPALLTNSAETLRTAAVAGAGLTALPIWGVADLLKTGELVRVLEDWRTPQSGIYAVFPSNRLMAAKVRLFVERVARALKGLGDA
jgi:DNA-binding transcriptional LysR family regulator